MVPKITLISPPKLYSFSARFYIGRGGAPPLNLAYLARAISNEGFDYQVIDAMATHQKYYIESLGIHVHGLKLDEIVDSIEIDTDIIGISSMFSNEYLIIQELLKKIRVKFPDKIIVLGGEHPTAMPDPLLKYDNEVDFIFYGEAESTLVSFLRNYRDEKPLNKTEGIIYLEDDGSVTKNPSMPRLMDLDNHLPLWDKIPVGFYLENTLSFSRKQVKSMPMIATRGCPYKCTFCSNEQMWGNRYVMRSIDSVINEMKTYVNLYSVSHIDFQDLSTSINKKWFVALLERMKSELPDVTWEMTVGTRSEILDEQVLKLLLDSGTTQLTYAPETGSYELSKKIKKKLNYKKLYESVDNANKLGIEVKAHIIIGFPEETFLDLIKTILMAFKLGLYGVKGVSVYTFSPYPGSEIFNSLYKPSEFTKEEYLNFLKFQMVNSAGARVFSLKNFFLYPREEMHTLVGNTTMILCYFLSMFRNPDRFFSLLLNPLKGDPKNPLEIGVHNFLKRIYIVK